MYKYVFFDLDGTLTQSEFGIMEAAERALEHFGIPVPDKENMKKFIGPPLYVSFHDIYGLSDEDSQKAIEIYREYYVREGVYKAPLYPGIKEMLKNLKSAGCKLAVTTSKPEALAVTVVKNEGIYEFFEGIIGPALNEHDPDKSILIRRALKALNIEDKREDGRFTDIIMIGDRFYDIEAAGKMGLDSVGVLYGYGSREELNDAGATYLAEDVSEITGIVLKEDSIRLRQTENKRRGLL